MQQKNERNSFFEPKTLIAVAAVALIYYGWQTYLGNKYPNYGKAPKTEAVQTADTKSTSNVPSESVNPVETKSETVAAASVAEARYRFNSEKVSFTVSSYGMGLSEFTVNDYQDKEKNKIKIGVSDTHSMFEMTLAEDLKPLHFNLEEPTPGNYVGTAKVGESTITRTLVFDPKTNSFTNTIKVSNPTEDFKKGFSLLIPETIHSTGSSSFLFPSYEHQDFFVVHNAGKKETVNFSGAKENFSKEFTTSSVVSVGSQYFAAAVLDKSPITPQVKVSAEIANKKALAQLTYKPAQLQSEMVFTEIFYVGPKSIDSLKAVDPDLAQIVDLGFFGFIATPLLYVMKACHSVVGNWGFAIILLTLLVRLCVLPFNVMSFRSMKAMQKVQPVIQALREKYKEDPMRLNQEMMATMKAHGANPIGGCLPMLLQIPIFFALYRVISTSVELYNSPFVLWITDLSAHDKYYVLPILMAVFMYIQQKITPSTMDPTQAKIMTFLPVIFSLFMLQLPSGLTLYMVVSTLFGIIQQYIIMREPKAKTA